MANFDYLFKILLLGDRSTGKEELCKKYISDKAFKEDLHLTLGFELYAKTIDFQGKKVKIQFWDFKAEERLNPLLPSYCSGSGGAIIMYDITNPRTLEYLDEWVRIIRENVGDIPIMLVGSKVDLENLREVSKQEIIEIVRKYNLSTYREISTKTGLNVENIVEEFINILIKNSKRLNLT